MVIIIGDIFAFLVKEHGIPIAGDLRKGINPLSISQLTFMDKHVNLAVKAGFLSRILALAVRTCLPHLSVLDFAFSLQVFLTSMFRFDIFLVRH
ncbi:unnamed protein product [Urochloa humidicola]